MSTWIKIVLGLAVTIIVVGFIMIAPGLAFLWALTSDAGASSKAELIQNYRTHETQLQQVKTYFNSVVPSSFQVYIEYREEEEIDLWVYKKTGPGEHDRTVVFQQWAIDPYDYERPATKSFNPADAPLETLDLAEVKQQLGWTDATFREIQQQLDAANCISVKSGEPTQIGFARSDMGKYSYNLFSQPPSDSLMQNRWSNNCSLEPLNRTVVLEYGGGAIGPQCFPDPK
ncbi:hypothetical protein EJV47_15020 [Hymenobacter gummosus]|uniref:Uncharacterized protein n=1 Tax=Hymenobacter gummosus TaxID=1776032 RepID=A0A3S0JG89_9BACT|nr:hypothetical protein [Hymenobacter gummosus]RTQ48904.1 hypothetical protein EJV47_15020 [Hymenobacter gummosus]